MTRIHALVVGLKYDHKLWHDMWPRIRSKTIEACRRAGQTDLLRQRVSSGRSRPLDKL